MIKKLIPEVLMVILLTVSLVLASGTSSVTTTPVKTATVAKTDCPPCPACPDGKTNVKATTTACKEEYCPPCPECPNGKYVCKDEKCESPSKK